MKIFYALMLLTSSIILPNNAHAQILTLFSEDFDGIPGPTAGGAGTYNFPSGWLLANVDNRTPSGSVAYMNEAWERREDFATNVNDSAAFSTSWYSPAGQADDWMWTPGIPLTGTNITLSWEAKAYDPSFADGYEVRIMVIPPTGGTGNIGNMLSASDLLFSIPAENTAWTTRTVSISSYVGKTVYIGFRNNTTDRFLLLIDDVTVTNNASGPTFFSEDFDGIPGPTAGGAGTYNFPGGWLLANVDNRTPSGSVAYVNEAWERREDFATNVNDSAAFSTSWYSPAGQADDWMWTPPIPLIGTNITLRWEARSYDPSFADGYEVRIMTVTPTGGNGNIGNMLSASTLLFSIASENTTWTTRTVDLSSYVGNTVYIGFRNNTTDRFLLVIDDIRVAASEALPLKLLDFWGTRSSSGNQLYWKVTEQSEILEYVIERSYDQTHFTPIGTLRANTQFNYNYQYTDRGAFGTISYYRLKIRETTGLTTYSKIVAIRNEVVKRIVLFPNPGKKYVYLSVPHSNETIPIELLDVTGRSLKKIETAIGAISITIDISSLANGVYYLRRGNEIVSFIKQ